MKDGYIQQVGTPKDVYFRPVNMFVAGFIGEPPMNFIKKAVQDGKIQIGNSEIDIKDKLGESATAYEGKEIVFGFRPEAITLKKQPGDYALNGMVELTEMLGDNANVYVDIDDSKAILKVTPHEIPEMDEEIAFFVPKDSVYLFDAKTEEIID